MEGGLHESNIRKNVDNIDYDCTQFDDFKDKVISSGQLSYAQLHEVMKNIFNFTVAMGRSLDSRFPELDFVVQNVSFLNPANRKYCDIEAVVRKYCRNSLNGPVVKGQYSVYRNDESMDYLFLQCEKQPDTFFSRLTQMAEYDQFGLLGVTLMCMSPDTVECERAFLSMNLSKDKCSTRMTQDNLESRLAVFMDTRTLSSFPFQDLDSI